jgi:hypothetical protein
MPPTLVAWGRSQRRCGRLLQVARAFASGKPIMLVHETDERFGRPGASSVPAQRRVTCAWGCDESACGLFAVLCAVHALGFLSVPRSMIGLRVEH